MLEGYRQRYYVRAYAPAGQVSAPSNTVIVDLPKPDYILPPADAARALAT